MKTPREIAEDLVRSFAASNSHHIELRAKDTKMCMVEPPSLEDFVEEAIKEERKKCLEFVASLALCDHMGDVADDVIHFLEQIGRRDIVNEWHNETEGDLSDLVSVLGKRGLTTLYGTELL